MCVVLWAFSKLLCVIVFFDRGPSGEENLSCDAWDDCDWISQSISLSAGLVTLNGETVSSSSFLPYLLLTLCVFLFVLLQVTWWAGPWKILTSSWPCLMAVESKTWYCLLPTFSFSTTWKAPVNWLRLFWKRQHASWRVVSDYCVLLWFCPTPGLLQWSDVWVVLSS